MPSLFDLIEKGEHQQQDFKHSIGSSKKIAITVAAFANTDGGRLLIGVKDNGKISGVRALEELHMIEGAAQVFCKPEVEFSYHVHRVQGKEVLDVWIPESKSKPHLAPYDDKWMSFIRVEDENFLTDPVILQYWKDQHTHSRRAIQYESEDKQILEFLKQTQDCTYKKVAKSLDLQRHLIIKGMAKLLRWEIIGYEIDDQGIYYFVVEEPIM